METQTAKLENVNKFSKYGLRRKPTYEEITNLLDENKKLGLPLPNRDATFFRNSPEGSFFDGIHQMEDLKDEQQRLLLRQMNDILMRQNIRTAGRTLHSERARLNAFRPPQIVEANMQVDEDGTLVGASRNANGNTQPTVQPTTAPPSTRLQQASQLNLELEQRRSSALKRREEIAMNEAEQIRKFTKPSLQEQLLGIQPPRVEPQAIPINSGDTDNEAIETVPTKSLRKPRKTLFKDASAEASRGFRVRPQSSNEPAIPIINAMDTSSSNKRGEPETRVEPRGKAGRPKKYKEGTDRADGTKREGDEPEETDRRAKRINKNKEKQQQRLEAKMAKEASLNVEKEEEEVKDTRKGSRVRQTIQKPMIPSKANNITIVYEALTTAKNRNTITAEEYKEFEELFELWKKTKGNEKMKNREKAKALYKRLYPKLKKKYDSDL